jgi:hypothetical protein
MPALTQQRTLNDGKVNRAASPYQAPLELNELIGQATRGLVQMFDAKRKLFCYRLNLGENGLVREGYSHRYTIIALLGLRQLERAGLPSPIDVKETLQSLFKDRNQINSAGDLGLLLWLCAEAAPEEMERICFSRDLKTALTLFPDARHGRTMELAWLLSGLAHAVLARDEQLSDLTSLTAKVFGMLRSNQGRSGIFGHLAARKTVSGMIRSRVGSFADQVYPIYALVRLAQAYDYDEPLKMAQKCADAICTLQGPLGQWWWHYDAHSGRAVQRYPVYSVHQDGMAPMALFALGEATGRDFSPSINQGLQWITGRNELKCNLQDAPLRTIWRSIFPTAKYHGYICELLTYWGLTPEGLSPRGLSIKMECRPYHLGWLLYAFAPRLVTLPQASLTVAS